MKRFWWIGGLLAFAVIIFFVTQKHNSPSNYNNSTLTIARVGKSAPNINIPTINGQQFTLSAYKGKPIVLVGLFNCSECAAYDQNLVHLKQAYSKQGLTILGVDVVNGETVSTLDSFKQAANINFPLSVYNQTIVSEYNLTVPDMTYVINGKGDVAYINQSPLSYAQLQKEVSQSL